MGAGEPIGGYFQLETSRGTEYWRDAMRLNTARSCLRCLIRSFHIRKLYVPRYTCPVVWDAVQAEGCEAEYYSVTPDLMPLSPFPEDAYILYTDYLGVCAENVKKLARRYPKLIVDCAQSFYSPPAGVAAFYSSRKFFGVPDGAYLCSREIVQGPLEPDSSADRCSHLLLRADRGPQVGYPAFLRNEERLSVEGVKGMSKLTQTLLKGIPYGSVAQTRRSNYAVLQEELGEINEWRGVLPAEAVPMAYPFLYKKVGLRQKLIEEGIFVPTFWKGQTDPDTGSYMERYLLPLPIDQRYNGGDMRRILRIVRENLSTEGGSL